MVKWEPKEMPRTAGCHLSIFFSQESMQRPSNVAIISLQDGGEPHQQEKELSRHSHFSNFYMERIHMVQIAALSNQYQNSSVFTNLENLWKLKRKANILTLDIATTFLGEHSACFLPIHAYYFKIKKWPPFISLVGQRNLTLLFP